VESEVRPKRSSPEVQKVIFSRFAGYLKAVWLEIFGPVFPGFPAEIDPRDPPRSAGPAPRVNALEKSAPQTTCNAISRFPKNPARLPSGT